MCGLAGIARADAGTIPLERLRRMGAALRHRGPDGSGIEADDRIGLVHTRLSILDVANGAQPMATDDGRLTIVFNGEIFNFRELRDELETRGHRFRTRTDTEVLLHGWEAWGEALLPKLNGQFAFAIADRITGSVVLGRDRFGILPLFYAQRPDALYFASEVKALLASGGVEAEVDPVGIDQVVTFWAARAPRTPFKGVRALEPGCWARWDRGSLQIRRWYALDLDETADGPADLDETLETLLRSAVDHRLVADVAVGGYLSGGLDSSLIAALAARSSAETFRTFAVAFEDPRYDESVFQRRVAVEVRSTHAGRRVTDPDIARVFPDVVWHAETPLLRTAPAPLYILSRLARDRGIKVVLSGEGADEVFGGYDLFKDAAVRLFCLRQPASTRRPRLFDRLYRHDNPRGQGGEFWRRYFLDAGTPDDPLFSHLPRFRLTGWIKEFYAPAFAATLREDRVDALDELRAELPPRFAAWSPLARATYLEMVTFLAPYLLAAQGDRMAMAHGVELRVPFLDHRLVEFAARLPAREKLLGLRDKVALRRRAAHHLPPVIAKRPKQPYRAPGVSPFFGRQAPEYVEALLDPGAVARTGIFDPPAVAGLVRRCRSGAPTGAREQQALVAILSTELWHRTFFGANAPRVVPEQGPAILSR